MKKFFVLALVLGLLLASITPVSAKGGALQLYGTIAEIDYDALTFNMLVETPLRYAGATITVQVTDATRLKECTGDYTSYRISFGDLTKGWNVRVAGAFVGGVFIATSVIQYVP